MGGISSILIGLLWALAPLHACDLSRLAESVVRNPHDWDGSVSVHVVDGQELSIWTDAVAMETFADGRQQLQLEPEGVLIIGRAQKTRPPYLHPSYQPSQVMPSGEPVTRGGAGDEMLSRAHFQLRRTGRGLTLTNGVPRPDSGVRAPPNGTRLLSPVNREMLPGEQWIIEPEQPVKILLPNGTTLLISAD